MRALPVLPALLSASAATADAAGRSGIVLGLAATFTIAIVALAQLVNGVGLASGAARTLAIVVLIGFGLILLIPDLAARVQAPLSRLARFGPKTRGDGFWSGVGGRRRAWLRMRRRAQARSSRAVTSVSAVSGATVRIVAVALSYTIGLSAVLLVYATGGRIVIDRIRRSARGHVVERTLGVVLIATGVLMAANLDVRFEEALAKAASTYLRSYWIPTSSAGDIQRRAEPARVAATRVGVRGASARGRRPTQCPATAGVSIPGVKTPSLPDLGQAPDFVDTQQWFNTPGGAPQSLAALSGHVVLVDFWTYTCINCIRTLPFVEGLYKQYHRYGLDIVGVETPEFTFEQNASNVSQAVKSDGITYPVVQDNQYGTWSAYQNQYWPAEYLIDAKGEVRHTQFGEGHYKEDEASALSGQLLYEAGARNLPPPMTAHAIVPSSQLATPETYLDDQRSQGFAQPLKSGGARVFARPRETAAPERVLARRRLRRRLGVDHADRRRGP